MGEGTPSESPTGDLSHEFHCIACGYSLRGIESQLCPECGTEIDRAALAVPQIPWAHRKVIGTARAYWRTVWLVIWRPARAASDINRPVGYKDARRFQHVTVLLAYIPLLAFAVWGLSDTELFHVRDFKDHPLDWLLELGTIPIGAFSLWLFLFTATGAPSYFFHPKSISIERQNRAIALSYYCCAPLSLLPILALLALLLLFMGDPARSSGELLIETYGLIAVSAIIVVGISISLWRCPITFLSQTTRCSTSRLFGLAIYLPVSWAFLASIVLVGIPAAYLFVSLFVLSMRR